MVTVLHNARIIDGYSSAPIERGFLMISDSHITAVGPMTDYAAVPDINSMDCEGYTVLPGLMDAHLHIYASGDEHSSKQPFPTYSAYLTQLAAMQHLQAHLKAGFTTLRDVGSENNPVWALRHSTREGWMDAPRLLASGKLLTVTAGHGTEYGVDMAWECEGASDLVKAVRRQHAEGADFIKVIASRRSQNHPEGYASWSVEDLSLAANEAHDLGLKVSAHVSGCVESIAVAIEAGVDSLEHGWGITRELAEKAATKGIFFVPTMIVFWNLARLARQGKWRRTWDEFVHLWGSEEDRLAEVRLAHECGLTIVNGSDAGNPETFHGKSAQELALLVEAGLTPLQAIQAATSQAAKLCGIQGETGSIAPGLLADLLIVEGNPLEDIRLLQDSARIKGVFKAGKLVVAPFNLTSKGQDIDTASLRAK